MSQQTNREQVNPVPDGRPTGRFTVQVCDAETGKVKRTYEADNYVTPMHYDMAKHHQTQLAQGGFFPQTDGTNTIVTAMEANGGIAGEAVGTPGIVPSFIICTDWDTAEDTTEDWGKGNITAFAPYAKVTALSTGRKGLINETESSINPNGSTITYVWDWSTTQGNGSFQSIMLGNVGVYSDTNAALYCGAGEHGRQFPWTDRNTGDFMNTFQLVSDNTTIYQVATSDDDGTPYCRWRDITTEFNGGAGATADASGRWYQIPTFEDNDWATQWTQIGTNWMTNSTGGSSSTYFAGMNWACCHDGTNIYFVRHGNQITLGVHAYNLGTGAALYDNTSTGWTPASVGVTYTRHQVGVTCVGTKLYAIFFDTGETSPGTYPDRKRIARLDATTGAFEAFVDLSSILAADQWLTGNIENDGTDLIVETTQGIIKVTTSGAYVANSNIGMPRLIYPPVTGSSDGTATSNVGHWAENAVAPDSLSARWQLGPYRTGVSGVHSSRQGPNVMVDIKFFSDTFSYNTIITPYRTYITNPFTRIINISMTSSWQMKQQHLFRHGSKLWLQERQAGTGTVGEPWDPGLQTGFLVYSIDGKNIFSRARLDSPVSKSSSETMKITYQISLPADPLHVIPHVDPWA